MSISASEALAWRRTREAHARQPTTRRRESTWPPSRRHMAERPPAASPARRVLSCHDYRPWSDICPLCCHPHSPSAAMGLAACFRAGTLRGYLLHSGRPSGSTPSPHITKPSIGAQHHRTCAPPMLTCWWRLLSTVFSMKPATAFYILLSLKSPQNNSVSILAAKYAK